jgi:hypothetical protein
VAGQNGTATNNGQLRLSQGTFNVGNTAGNALAAGANAQFTIEGGALNVIGPLQTANAVTYTQTGGTVTTATSAINVSGTGSFDLSSASNTFNMSGGTIVVVQANTNTSARWTTASPPAPARSRRHAADRQRRDRHELRVPGRGSDAEPGRGQHHERQDGHDLRRLAREPGARRDRDNNATLNLNAFAFTDANVTIGTGATLNLNGTTLTTTARASPTTARSRAPRRAARSRS